MAGLRLHAPMLHPERQCAQLRGCGQSQWLVVLCKTLSFSIPSRFIPALSLTSSTGGFFGDDPGFLADAADPFVSAGRGIAGASGLLAFKSSWTDVFAAFEQGAEQGDFSGHRAAVMNAGRISLLAMAVRFAAHDGSLASRYLDVDKWGLEMEFNQSPPGKLHLQSLQKPPWHSGLESYARAR